jgi:hemerythrin
MSNHPLYIVWQESFTQGEPIIDEQHHGLLATINTLHYFIQQGYELRDLLPTIKILISFLVFHYKTEEGILRSTEYPDIASYDAQMNQVIDDFKLVCEKARKEQSPELVLGYLKRWWSQHLEHHKRMTPFLHNWSGEYCRVD